MTEQTCRWCGAPATRDWVMFYGRCKTPICRVAVCDPCGERGFPLEIRRAGWHETARREATSE